MSGRVTVPPSSCLFRGLGGRKLSLRVGSANVGAAALYRRVGFTQEGVEAGEVRLPCGRWEDMVCMAKFI